MPKRPGAGTTPVVLLIFANDRAGQSDRYLMVPEERRQILDALQNLDDRIETLSESNATPQRLFKLLARHNDRIIGVHFAGHATGEALALEDRSGRPSLVHHDGLAQRLGQLPSLRWVFLNGCGTAPQVDAIHAHAPVPVIATSQAIVDAAAVSFAATFYDELASGAAVGEAFQRAEAGAWARNEGPLCRSDVPLEESFTRMLRPGGGDEAIRCPWVLEVPDARPQSDAATLFDPLPGDRLKRGLMIASAICALGIAGWLLMPDPDDTDHRVADAAHRVADTDPAPADSAPPDGAVDAMPQPIDAYVHPAPPAAPLPLAPWTIREALPETAHRPAAVRTPAATASVGQDIGASASPRHTPPRIIDLPPLLASATPVTRAQFRSVVGPVSGTPRFVAGAAATPRPDAPVTGVSRDDAIGYCEALNRLEGLSGADGWRLPTSDEWEGLCRAGSSSDANAARLAPVDTAGGAQPPVGGAPNAWGLRDMLGVVEQWTDTSAAGRYGGPSRWLLRGGHRHSRPERRRCSAWSAEPPHHDSVYTGFRIVRPAP